MKRMHNAWMRAVAGRLKSDYRYSKDIVYNNFVWPEGSGGNWNGRGDRENVEKEDLAAEGLVGSCVPRDRDVSGPAGERDARPYQNPVNPVNPGENDSPRSPGLHGKISSAAQEILDVRQRYFDADKDCSLASLYDPLAMPPELVKAHARLDSLVDKAYGRTFANDAERVALLFALYAEKVEKLKGGEGGEWCAGCLHKSGCAIICAFSALIKAVMLYQTRKEMLATLGASIRSARLAANLSLETTAARSGISLTALRNLEGGRNASTVTLLEVCRTLRRTDWIIGIAPPELDDSLFDCPEGKRRQRATPHRRGVS